MAEVCWYKCRKLEILMELVEKAADSLLLIAKNIFNRNEQ